MSCVILLGLVIAAVGWRVSRGPILLDFLEPRLVWHLGDDPEALTLAIKNPAVTWGGWRRPLDLTAGPVEVSDNQGRPVIEVENTSVGLAWLELFRKKVALTRIEVRAIHLHLLRTADGRIIPGFEATAKETPSKPPDTAESTLAQKIQEALTSPEPVPPFERLTKVSVVQSTATLEDRVLGVTWEVPNLNLRLRRGRAGLRIAADATLDVDSNHTGLKIDGTLDRHSQRLNATVSVTDLHPYVIGQLIPALDPLTHVTSPVNLDLTGEVSLDGTIHTANVELESQIGQVKAAAHRTDVGELSTQVTLSAIRLSDLADLVPQLAVMKEPVNGTASAVLSPDFKVKSAVATVQTEMGAAKAALDVDSTRGATVQVDLSGLQPWKLEELLPALGRVQLSIDLRATAELTPDRTIDRATVHVACGAGTVHIPEINNVPYQIRRATLEADATDALKSLEISDVTVDLAGLTVHATGAATRGEKRTRITSSANLTDFSASSISQYWPSRLAPDVLDWIATSITAGTVHDAAVRVALSLPSDLSGGLRLDDLNGSFGLSDLSVTYLSPMPPVTGLSGTAQFTAEGFDFTVDGGGVEDLSLTSARLGIAPLAGYARLTVDATGLKGPVSTAAKILGGPPLELMGAGLPQPDQFSGAADSHLVLDVPLSSSDPNPLGVSGSSKLTGVGVTGWVKGYDLSDGSLDLGFDLAKLDIAGTAAVNGVAASFTWRENLAGGPTPRTIHTRTTVNNHDLEALGVPDIPQLEGPIGVTIDVTGRRDGSMDIALDGDLTRTAATVAPLGWSKAAGSAGRITAKSVLSADRRLTVNQFDVSADGFHVSGHLATGSGLASLHELVIEGLDVGRTQLGGSLTERHGGGWVVEVGGRRLDVRPLLDTIEEKTKETPTSHPEGGRGTPTLEINIGIQEIVDGTDHTLGRLNLSADRDGAVWNRVEGNLEITAANVVRVHLAPGVTSGHDFKVTADNAGEFLSTILPRSELVGGALDVTGHRATESGPLTGHVQLEDYVVTQSEALTRILQLASIGGAVDLLSGTGIQFKRLDADFGFSNKVLTIRGFQSHGSSIGITADGTVDFETKILNVNGAVIPMSRIQSLLGDIPGLGVILSGTKGEGLLAVNYLVKGPLAKPQVSVNPMSGLTPGILRDIFRTPDKEK